MKMSKTRVLIGYIATTITIVAISITIGMNTTADIYKLGSEAPLYITIVRWIIVLSAILSFGFTLKKVLDNPTSIK
jgi:hypothetical protein